VVNATAGVPQVLAGSAYGDDLFLGGDVIFNIASNLSVNSLGGAGNTSDPNVTQDANDPNALGGIIKTGAGTLTLTGTSYYTGATTIHQGTVALASGATEQGTSAVIVGQNSGDTATLTLGSGSTLTTFFGTNPPIVLGQAAGSTGSLVIGSGAGSSGAILGANIVQGGAGGGNVVFNQNYAAGSGSDTVYPFLSAITGNLQVVQDGPGTTLLQPLANNGVNTFSGGIIVNGGTLQLGNNTALPSGNAITVNGGTFDFNGYTSTPIGALTMSGGTLINSSGNGSIVASSITTASGTIGVPIAGNTSVVQLGVGTTTLTTTNAYGGYTILHDGRLVLAPEASITGTAQIFVGMNSGDIATLYLENSSTLGVNGFNTTNDLPVILGQSLGSSGSVVIGSGSGSSGAYIAARCFQGGAGGGSMVFDQNYAAGSGSNTVYAFLSDITGNLQVIQNGPGTTLLSPLYGSNSYSGATTLNGGTLLATTSGALGSSTNITVNAGATLNLGAGDVAFGNQQFTLNGGEFLLSANQTQNFGNWNILGSSIFDLGGTTSTLTFNSFSINGTLDIWNWSASSDTIDINGATDAPYNNVVFYSDGGTTEIGTGAIIDGRLEAVPEPSPDALLGFGLGALASVIAARRKLS
jgi:autotransporter-associated beta strand protein